MNRGGVADARCSRTVGWAMNPSALAAVADRGGRRMLASGCGEFGGTARRVEGCTKNEGVETG